MIKSGVSTLYSITHECDTGNYPLPLHHYQGVQHTFTASSRGFIFKKNYFNSSIHLYKKKVKNQVIQLQQKNKKIKDTTLSFHHFIQVFHHFIQVTVSFNSFRLKLLKQCFASNELINPLSLI